MKILLVHNRYQHAGGEDEVVRREQALLLAGGNVVVEYFKDNDVIRHYGLLPKVTLAARTVWAWDTYRELRTLIGSERFDLVHFHNTVPLISPSAYYACHEAGVPVVQTLHNYRLFCPAATFFHNGRVCEECVQRSAWRGVRHACYRGSRTATAALALMLGVHRRMGTWTRMVDCYIALTEFARRKFIQAGLLPRKIAVKPNFLYPDPRPGGCRRSPAEQYALFIGRFSEEKGLHTLIAAWAQLKGRIPLVVVGDGPLRAPLGILVSRLALSRVYMIGAVNPDQIATLLDRARFLVLPSECYETFGLVAVEAFACGVPVLASRLGAMEELVTDGQTGLTFRPGDPDDLAGKVNWAWSHRDEMEFMGRRARREYEAKYTPERNYATLMNIYKKVVHGADQSLFAVPSTV